MTETLDHRSAVPGKCTCGSIYGCHEHGPQPRERAVPCLWCGKPTWTVDGICAVCAQHIDIIT